jgi:hypothetical protein
MGYARLRRTRPLFAPLAVGVSPPGHWRCPTGRGILAAAKAPKWAVV